VSVSPFRPDLVEVWIFRTEKAGLPTVAGWVPGPIGRRQGPDGAGGAAATAPGIHVAAPETQVAAPETQVAAPETQVAAPETQVAAPGTSTEILMLRRSPSKIVLPGLWQCVSGSLEDGESIVAGALRELQEETGFGAAEIEGFFDLDQVNQFHAPSVAAIVTSAIFAVRVRAGAEPALSHEHDAMRWVPPAEALELAIWPAYRESIRRIQENLLDPERAIWFELTLGGQRARR
jgi:8-oxo-dGTP pyrophosphatase MutT (NUDIX family)